MTFAWPCLLPKQCVDPATKYHGHLLLAHIIAKFAIHKRIVLQVFHRLGRCFVPHISLYVKGHIDLLILRNILIVVTIGLWCLLALCKVVPGGFISLWWYTTLLNFLQCLNRITVQYCTACVHCTRIHAHNFPQFTKSSCPGGTVHRTTGSGHPHPRGTHKNGGR